MGRKKGALNSWSPELIARCVNLRRNGLYFHEIAKRVGKSKTRVQQICKVNPPPIDPEKARQITERNKIFWAAMERGERVYWPRQRSA